MFKSSLTKKLIVAGGFLALAATAGVTASYAKMVCYKDPAHGFVCTKVK